MEGIAFGKMIFYKDEKYNFVEFFNEDNGFYLRSNVIHNNKETEIEATMRSFPELLDIGIMGTCVACEKGICKVAGIDCYQNASSIKRSNMSLNNYRKIISQCNGKVFQVALGGAGDPNKHENFEEILVETRKSNIVPNLTTSGYTLNKREIELIKKYCGAVAVSFYSTLNENGNESNNTTISSINRLVNAGCVTNIHYVISKKNIHEAMYRIKNDLFPNGINAIIFLLYKPVGLAKTDYMLTENDIEYRDFLREVTSRNYRYKIGFDSCQTPALRMFSKKIAPQSLEMCEASRFSMYIDCDLIAFPCSFGWENARFSVDLNKSTILEAWNSKEFGDFRNMQNTICSQCKYDTCYNCALDLGINICGLCQNNFV